jgi:hypothetical protein
MTPELPSDKVSDIADRVSNETVDRLGLLFGDRMVSLNHATIQFSAQGKCYSLVVHQDGTVRVRPCDLHF